MARPQGQPPLSQFPRIVITGANGAGKTRLARMIAQDRPIWHYDALRLTTGWQRRPTAETLEMLENATDGARWVFEGGPSALPHVLPKADLMIWLQPSRTRRAIRLLRRTIQFHGRTRPELPDGNTENFWQQCRFAWHSLAAEAAFRDEITRSLEMRPELPRVVLRTNAEIVALSRSGQSQIQRPKAI